MNGRISLAVAAALGLSACGQTPGDGALPQSETPPLAGARLGGAFSLVSEDGKPVTDAAFKGRYRLVYFGYTFCPDICPVDVQRLMQGLSRLEKQDPARATRIQPLFVTVDPERDTPQVLAEFTDAFHPRLIGLTGSLAQIEAAAKAYGVYFQKGKQTAPGAYLVDHSRSAVLYDPDGKPLALIPHDGSPEEIARELGKWVK